MVIQEHAQKRRRVAKEATQMIDAAEIERDAQRQQIASPIVKSQLINHAVLHNNVGDTNVNGDLATQGAATKRQRVSTDTVDMVESATAEHDANIQEMKDTYFDTFKHSSRGRWASNSEWLTSQIENGCHKQSTSPPAAALVP